MTNTSPITSTSDGRGTIVTLYVQPRASRTEIVGLHDGAVRLRVAAPPVDGEANDEVLWFLSRKLHVAKAEIRILRGETGRRKRVRIDGRTADEVTALLLS